MNKIQKKLHINSSYKSILSRMNYFTNSRNRTKLAPIIKYTEYLNTLNYYKNLDKFHENSKNLLFTNEEINSHINQANNDIFIKSNSAFKKKILAKEKKCDSLYFNTLNNIIKKSKTDKNLNKNKPFIKIETNISGIDHISPNLNINKVDFNFINTFHNNKNPIKLINLNNKLKKITFQNYNKYIIDNRNKQKIKKSYSTEKNFEVNSEGKIINKMNKPNDYFLIFKLNQKNKKSNKYINAKSQIKMENEYKKKMIKKFEGKSLFDNIIKKIDKKSYVKIKLNNIFQRTNSKNLDDIKKVN